MKFYPLQLFHIYNQGNNQNTIFFNDENYKYFLWKMRAYLLPFGDIIAWVLMPNHFHWQFYVKQVEIQRKVLRTHVDQVEFQRRVHKYGKNAKPVHRAYSRFANEDGFVTLNEAIGHLEKSYAKAIHKSSDSSGSLFRPKCKAKDGWIDEFITLKKLNGQTDYRFLPGTDYGYQCFDYIHSNPKKAGLVKNDVDWKYSSARDYAGLRQGTLCNLEYGKQLRDFI